MVLNRRPLVYCEDDVELPTLSPNMLIFGKANNILDGDLFAKESAIHSGKETHTKDDVVGYD